jgi:CubicO group peptidase (beta-lactamase class C family)
MTAVPNVPGAGTDVLLEALPRTSDALEEDRERGRHFGGQLFVSRDGETVVDAAFGELRPGVPLETGHLMLWLSSGKPVTAVAIARLWEEGALALDDPVCRHLPEFAAGGKEAVTLRHLLTHTGGIRTLDLGWPERSWPEIVGYLCEMKLEPRWIPGRKAGYHLSSSWFVLGEVVARLTGESFSEHVRSTVFEPLGMASCWIGMPQAVYRERAPAIASMYDTQPGRTGEAAIRLEEWTDELHLTRPSPGSNAVGPLRELARLYEMLRRGGELDGERLLRPQTVEALTARQRVGLLDHTFRQRLDWGLGFVLDSRHYGESEPAYGYGEHASTRVFGHSGYRSSIGFADPEAGLVVAMALDGVPSAAAHRSRTHRLVSAIYEDLGLAREPYDPDQRPLRT